MEVFIMKNTLFVLGLISLLFFIPAASAWGPATHTWITNELLDNPKGNPILEMCAENEENRAAFMAGSMIPDITVVYYFQEGGRVYRATHNWNFQQEVMNQATNDHEKAFAYGIAQHLISDSVAHQYVVPSTIRQTNIPNWLIHPLVEQKYDAQLAQKYPELREQRTRLFDAILYGPHGDRYIEMVENAISDEQLNVRDLIIKLAAAFDSYYDSVGGAKAPSGVGIFRLYPFISKICDFIAPLTALSGTYEVDAAAKRTLDENYNIFSNWGARHILSPHGFDEISEAEKDSGVNGFAIAFTMYVLAIFIAPLAVLLFLKKPFYAILSFFILLLSLLGWIMYIYLTL
jgi:hypothetical protein